MEIKHMDEPPSKRWCTNWLAKADSQHAARPVKRLERARIEASSTNNLKEFYDVALKEIDMKQ